MQTNNEATYKDVLYTHICTCNLTGIYQKIKYKSEQWNNIERYIIFHNFFGGGILSWKFPNVKNELKLVIAYPLISLFVHYWSATSFFSGAVNWFPTEGLEPLCRRDKGDISCPLKRWDVFIPQATEQSAKAQKNSCGLWYSRWPSK